MILEISEMSSYLPDNAEIAAGFLKNLSNSYRLSVLCALIEGEKSVSELIELTGSSQTSMSQHLLKLREDNIVTFRREHRTLYYSISHPAVKDLISVLYKHFCN